MEGRVGVLGDRARQPIVTSASTHPLSGGARVPAVQRMLGHAKASMTVGRYADPFDSELNDLAVDFDSVIASVHPACTGTGQ